ncbi:MAG: adenylosuccinate synthetase [Mogibacterium sp.]|nr:adenylosuccinate synthetase [Mogibacterium sp.]
MQTIKVIIGASFGDEGKGLATDFFGAKAGVRDTVNVMTNGGPQRGHTVELPDGARHVFKHFGSATFRGAATYYSERFLVNPMEFLREYEALSAIHRPPEAYMDPRCRWTTPWDMLVNQMLLEKRGIHNSCGFGIWETVLRYRRGQGIRFHVLAAMNREDRLQYLRSLRDGYFVRRLRELGIAEQGSGAEQASSRELVSGIAQVLTSGTVQSPAQNVRFRSTAGYLQEYFFSEDLLARFEEDCETLRYLCPMRDEDWLRMYRTVLFENGQGLLLDGNAKGEKLYTTPTTTGVGNVFRTVENVFRGADVEVCYVTRSYLTRHGDGTMPGEITDPRELATLLPGVSADGTNTGNRFQGDLRYGIIDTESLAERIRTDFAHCGGTVRNQYHPSVMVTHYNEFDGIDTARLTDEFGKLYLSDGRTVRDTEAVVA